MNENNSTCSYGDDSNSYTSIALALMQQELPQYIQNMFKAAGYDTVQIFFTFLGLSADYVLVRNLAFLLDIGMEYVIL